MKTPPRPLLLTATVLLVAGWCVAQSFDRAPGGGGFGGGRRGGGRGGRDDPNGPIVHTEGGDEVNEDTVRTARETATHSTGFANWTNAPGFERDVFTFTRVIWKFNPNAPRGGRGGFGGGFGGGGFGGGRGFGSSMGWVNDYPDSDLNLSYRLQELTSLRTDPDARVLKLTNSELAGYPFIYMVKPGRMGLRDDEVLPLRRFLQNGGVLMADDFWGDGEWAIFETEMKRVLPGRNWTELPIGHPLFHQVFDLRTTKEDLQVPSIHSFERTGRSYRGGEDTRELHVRAWLDERDRIQILATHNTDNGDGWEREGEDPEYFSRFSERRAYPLGINIIFYLMTH